MFLMQTSLLLPPYLFLLPQAMLRLPPRIAQTSKALLNLMLSPLSYEHHLPLVLLMPIRKLIPSEDVRYLPVVCPLPRSRTLLPHKAISWLLHPLMIF